MTILKTHRKKVIWILLGLIVILLLYSCSSKPPLLTYEDSPPLNWKSSITKIKHTLNSVIFVDGRFIAIGEQGTIISSTDGIYWEHHRSGITSRLHDIVYGGGQYMAVGNQGTILTSEYGNKWIQRKHNPGEWLRSLSYGNRKYVAISSEGVVYTSVDGIRWEDHGRQFGYMMDDIIFAEDRFITVGIWNYGNISEEGEEWKSFHGGIKTTGNNSFRRITFGNDLYVATGGEFTERIYGHIYTSIDGTNWNRVLRIEDNPFGITYGDGKYVAAGLRTILHSKNGKDWVSYRLQKGSNGLRDIAYGNGRFVAVGSRGIILTGNFKGDDESRN